MVKAVLHDGVIQPLSPLPDTWSEGQELLVQEAGPVGLEDWDAWEQEIENLAANISPEDHLRVEAALAEADREAKEFVRRQMGLD
ncbi:MAG TPA: hypothetical protein VEW48_15860 [Thermoanaerobaculia bacterium]|nr:hypothetical protein [Thermoanaerobaculia bacterium]